MGVSYLFNSKGSSSVAASTTLYWLLAQAQCGNNISSTTEAPVQIPYRTAGKISNLSIRLVTNDRNASTLALRKNTAAGNSSVSITGSTTGDFTDASNSDTIAAGDLVCTQLVTGSGGTNFTAQILNALFTPSINSRTMSKFAISNTAANINVNAASTTFFQPLCGQATANVSSETNVPFTFKTPGTLKNLSCQVLTNTSVAAITVGSRKNSANGNLSLSVTALTTGLFEDTSNSDTLVSGDTVNYFATTGAGTASAALVMISCEFISVNGVQQIAAASASTNVSVAGGVRYFSSGDIDRSSTELDMSIKTNSNYFANNLYISIPTNTITDTSTFDLRKNSASGSNTVSIASSTTGTFNDSTHVDTFVSGDKFNYRFSPGATGTSAAVAMYGHTLMNIPETNQFFGAGL